jgi:hypothetical protein
VSLVHDFVAPANPGFQVLAPNFSVAIRRGPGERFCYYAKRVKSLDISGMYTGATRVLFDNVARRIIDPRLVQLWTNTNELRFPLLRSLTISDLLSDRQYSHLASTIRTLLRLSPIEHLTLHIYRDGIFTVEPVQAELRHEILDVCQNLEWLSICDIQAGLGKSGASTEWSNFAGDMISHATRLRHCTVALPMKAIDFHHLSRLENLASFTMGEMSPPLDHPLVLPAGSFPGLETLELHEHTTSATVTRSVLSFPPNGCLKRVIVKYYQPITMVHIHNIRSLLGRHLTLSSILFESSMSDDADFNAISGEVEGLVEFLPPLPHLTSLEMIPSKRTPIDLPLIESILQLYPSLCSVRVQDPCPVSLTQLRNILGVRPLLRELPIRIRSGELPPLGAMLHPERLRFGPILEVSNSADSPALRRTVKALFPNVHTLRLASGDSFRAKYTLIELRA